MKFIVLDTCVVLHILRGNAIGQKCQSIISEYDENAATIISVVTKAELESLKTQLNWGENKSKKLKNYIDNMTCIDISSSDNILIEAYAKIDAYSKRKGTDPNGNLLNNSAKTIGKNDLWIAATAHVLEVPLLSADNDFDHLDTTFLNLIKVK